MHAELPEDVHIDNYRTTSSIGDYTEEFTITFSSAVLFNNFCSQLDTSSFEKETKWVYSKTLNVNNFEKYFIKIDFNKKMLFYVYYDL